MTNKLLQITDINDCIKILLKIILLVALFPIIIILAVVFLLESLVSIFFKKQKLEQIPPINVFPVPVTVVIPNYNGKKLLSQCLPNLIKNINDASAGSEIIVVDDASQDGSVDFLKQNFSTIKIVPLKINVGFGAACNIGVSKAVNRIIVLLNSDVKVKDGFLNELIKHFNDPSVFTVQPKMYSWNEKDLNGGLNIPREIFGFFALENEYDGKRNAYIDVYGPTMYAIGGAMAFDKLKWESLGGFDDIYAPFCWEDIDICYRALKRGWKVMYEPNSEVIHLHHGTLSEHFRSSYKKRIEERNELIFIWKNIQDNDKIFLHLFLFPLHVLWRFFKLNDIGYAISFIKAIKIIIPIMQRRVIEKINSQVSDKIIIKNVLAFYSNMLANYKPS